MSRRRDSVVGSPERRNHHSRRGAQVKQDLAFLKERLAAVERKLDGLVANEQDAKQARRERDEAVRLMLDAERERDQWKAKCEAKP